MPKKQKNKSKLTEQQKLVDFLLSKGHTTVVVDTGKKDAEKKFLGYEFSNRRGQEGLHEYDDGSMLYGKNEDNSIDLSDDTEKVNYYIRESFKGVSADDLTIPDSLQNNVRVTTQENLFDFCKGNRINVHPIIKYDSIYDFDYISKILTKLESGSRPVGGKTNLTHGIISIGGENITNNSQLDLSKCSYISEDYYVKQKTGKISKGDILINKDGACTGKLTRYESDEKALSNEHCFVVNFGSLQEYMCYLLQHTVYNNMMYQVASLKTAQAGLNRNDFENIKVPIPPKSIQDSIVSECSAVDDEVKQALADIEKYQKVINALISGLTGKKALIGDKDRFDVGIGRRMLGKDVKGKGEIPVYSANVREPFGYTGKLLDSFDTFDCGTALWSIDNDWDTNYFPADYKFRPTDHTGYIRVKDDSIHPYIVAKLLYNAGLPHHFTRDYRASGEKIKELSIPIPDKAVSDDVATKCLALEKKIKDANYIINTARVRKDAILDKYLK